MDNMVGSCSAAIEEDDDELSDEEVALDVGQDEGSVDLDDADASDLDIGLKLPEPGDTDDGANTNLAMDFGELFAGENDVAEAGDDDSGPPQFDTSIGIEQLDAEDLSDDALGLAGSELELEHGRPLATYEGDEEGALETFDLFIADESECEVAENPWNPTSAASGDFEVVSSFGDWTFAGGSDAWLGKGETGSAIELGAVGSAVLLGAGDSPSLLVSTKLGQLFRIDSARREPCVVEWKEALGLNSRAPATLGLCRLEESQDCVALSSTGGVLRLTDEGVEQVILPARAAALPNRADRAIVLGESEGRLCLMRAESLAGPWHLTPVPEQVVRVFRRAPVTFAAQARVMALANRYEGSFVSADGGLHFQPVAGTAASVALTCGSYRDALRVWVVVSHEVRGQSDLLMIDPEHATAVRLARFETRDPREDVFAPVTALAYEPATESLYATGAFGLIRFSPSTE